MIRTIGAIGDAATLLRWIQLDQGDASRLAGRAQQMHGCQCAGKSGADDDDCALAILLIGVAIVAFPVYLAVIASTHDNAVIANGQMPLLPGTHGLETYWNTIVSGTGRTEPASAAAYSAASAAAASAAASVPPAAASPDAAVVAAASPAPDAAAPLAAPAAASPAPLAAAPEPESSAP